MACRARVISGATILQDDLYVQVKYQPKCPSCGRLTEDPMMGVAMPGSPLTERSYCSSCNKSFDIKIVRDE